MGAEFHVLPGTSTCDSSPVISRPAFNILSAISVEVNSVVMFLGYHLPSSLVSLCDQFSPLVLDQYSTHLH